MITVLEVKSFLDIKPHMKEKFAMPSGHLLPRPVNAFS